MRFTYTESMCDPKQYCTLAVEAEQAGYDSFTVPESILYPQESTSKYPYTPDGDREFLKAGGVFDDDQIDAFIDLKMAEVLRFEMTPHPVEFDMYYSV